MPDHPQDVASDTLSYKELARQTRRSGPSGTAIVPAQAASRAPVPTLILIHPVEDGPRRRYPLDRGPVVIGRDPACEVVAATSSVSRRHARIERGPDGRYLVTDLGSSNGTFVNNARVAARALGDGDYLQLGGCVFRFAAGPVAEPDTESRLARRNSVDPVTVTYTRRALEEFLDQELAGPDARLGLILLDLDLFRAVNDTLGHACGDHVLRSVGAALRAVVRAEDYVARSGGDEFAVALPGAGAAETAACAERVRAAVAGLDLEYAGAAVRVTVSVGVVAVAGDEALGLTAVELLSWAGQQVADAKQAGRDRVRA